MLLKTFPTKRVVKGHFYISAHAVFGNLDLVYLVALHEIGHVLGIGVMQYNMNLHRYACNNPSGDHHFPGEEAVRQFNLSGGQNYSRYKIPTDTNGHALKPKCIFSWIWGDYGPRG